MQFIRLTCTNKAPVRINFDLVFSIEELKTTGTRIVLDPSGAHYFDVCENPADVMALIQTNDRHLFASAAMNGLLSRPTRSTEPDMIATEAFRQADAMLSNPLY